MHEGAEEEVNCQAQVIKGRESVSVVEVGVENGDTSRSGVV